MTLVLTPMMAKNFRVFKITGKCTVSNQTLTNVGQAFTCENPKTDNGFNLRKITNLPKIDSEISNIYSPNCKFGAIHVETFHVCKLKS